MRTLFVLRGAPGAGKSTLIRHHGLTDLAVGLDDLRRLYSANLADLDGQPALSMSFGSEKRVVAAFKEVVTARIRQGATFVLDCTNPARKAYRDYASLVEHGQHFHAQIQRRVAIGYGLRFHTLRGINHQQSPFTGRERARYFIGEVHVAGRVDQVQVVDLAILGLVVQGRRLGLDGDAPLLFDVHGVEHLGGHLTLAQATAVLDQAIGQCGLAVIDVGDDGEVANMVHVKK